MSARASRLHSPPRLIKGDGWATGLIEVQAVQSIEPACIATVRCESVEEARATAQRLLDKGLDLCMLCIVFDADRASARTINLLKEAS